MMSRVVLDGITNMEQAMSVLLFVFLLAVLIAVGVLVWYVTW